MQQEILLPADRLVLVVLPSQSHQRGLDNSSTKPQNQMQRGLCTKHQTLINKNRTTIEAYNP